MSVVGFDIGSQTCYIAVARGGGIETIANEYSDRCTPTCVSMCEKNRFIGVSAKNQMISNFKNTIWGWKKLIGQSFRDKNIQQIIHGLPFDFVEEKNGSVGLQVNYLNEKRVFLPEQFTAMMLTKLKETAEIALNSKVVDCVISVPCYFTEVQRRMVLNASQIVGLNVLRLMNDTTATALTYGIYKDDLPAVEEKPRNVVFVDMGHSDLQLSVCAFNKGKLKMLATTADSSIGGSNFDYLLADYFADEFQKKSKINVKANPRAYVRLTQECEKLKKIMSANTQEIPLNIECFIDEEDLHGKMSRDLMEQMAAPILSRVEYQLKQILHLAKLQPEDIYAVEIVGGSTRVASIKDLIRQVYLKEASTTLNSDEAVARGCALQCAILSPSFRVRDFSITDAQNYPIKLTTKSPTNDDLNNMEIFSLFAPIPASKLVTFYRQEPFVLEAHYDSPHIAKENSYIGKFFINDVKPTATGEASKVKVKVRINLHGMFNISNAILSEKIENQEESEAIDEKMQNGEGDKDAKLNDNAKLEAEQHDQQKTNNQNSEMSDETPSNAQDLNNEATVEKVKKQKVKCIELNVSSIGPEICNIDVNKYMELENEMIVQDKHEKQREDAKNTLEEYVYEMRNKICAHLSQFIRPEEKDSFLKMLDEAEQWLYDEGEDEKKQVYLDRYNSLKKIGEPVVMRYNEASNRPAAFEALAHSLQIISKSLQACIDKDGNSHLDAADIEKVKACIVEKQAWFDKHVNLQINNFDPPTVTLSMIKSQYDLLNSTCNPIVNKPKPKPKEETPKVKDASKNGKKEKSTDCDSALIPLLCVHG